MGKRLTPEQVAAKRALLRVADKEMTELSGRFLTDEEQLRVLSLGDEIYRLEGELAEHERAGFRFD